MAIAVLALGGGVTVAQSQNIVPAAIPDPSGGDAVEDGPDGSRVASFDPAPEHPDTRYSEPAPGVAPGLPIGRGWARSVDLAASDCPNADADPTVTAEPVVRAATLCLLNAERSSAGLVTLTENAQLRKAAIAHATDMVKRVYFSHESPAGTTFVTRISKTKYVAPGYHWTAGENLGWGAKGLATPRVIVRDWMNSTEHRANILRGKFREIGIGIVLGAPRAGKDRAATYTTEYGARAKIGKKKKKKKHKRRRRARR